MNIERERRWLVKPGDIPASVLSASAEHLTQGYLSPFGVVPVVRVRLIQNRGDIKPWRGVQTVKAPKDDGMAEIEFNIGVSDAEDLMRVSLAKLEKVRYTYPLDDSIALELDVFTNPELDGLAIVEIEVPAFNYPIEIPSWFGPEITGVKELSNVGLAYNPEKAKEYVARVLAM